MKRKVLILCVTLAVIMSSFALFACDNGDDGHIHEYVDYVYNNDATCINDGTETAQCTKCSKKDTRVKADTATGIHDYVDYICTGCGDISSDAPATEGLSYTGITQNGQVVGYKVAHGSVPNAPTKYIKIPSEHEGRPVTAISNSGFSSFYDMVGVSIPSSVTEIGAEAFEACYTLKNITLPDGVTSIGAGAFEACKKLATINIPDGVSLIGARTFYNCPELTKLTIPSSVKYVSGGNSFFNCGKLIQKEGGVSYVDKWVVGCDASVSTVTLRADTVGIASFAFQNCRSLTSIKLPENVISIGYCAFDGCSNLSSITIPQSVTFVENCAIQNCSKELIIYCEVAQKPDGWESKWNYNNRTVRWDYKNSIA